MSKQTQSFPAFPAQEISLRDYFIAHAPAEPQPWFMPSMPPAPDLSIWIGNSGKKYDGERAAMSSEEGVQGRVRPANKDAYESWRNEQAKQRYVQWPAAWADEMLKAREANTGDQS